jgi:hypothetical protein
MALGAVAFVIERILWARFQFRLSTLLASAFVVGGIFAALRIERQLLMPAESWGFTMLHGENRWQVLPLQPVITLALACMIYTAGWLAARLARSFYSLSFHRPT